MFMMIDLDSNGYVTLREIERVLAGTAGEKVLVESFEESDTGITFELDSEECPVIHSIADQSHAYFRATLVPGLRLLRVNSVEVISL